MLRVQQTHDLLFEAFADFLLVVCKLFDDDCLPLQPQSAVLVELLFEAVQQLG